MLLCRDSVWCEDLGNEVPWFSRLSPPRAMLHPRQWVCPMSPLMSFLTTTIFLHPIDELMPGYLAPVLRSAPRRDVPFAPSRICWDLPQTSKTAAKPKKQTKIVLKTHNSSFPFLSNFCFNISSGTFENEKLQKTTPAWWEDGLTKCRGERLQGGFFCWNK